MYGRTGLAHLGVEPDAFPHQQHAALREGLHLNQFGLRRLVIAVTILTATRVVVRPPVCSYMVPL